MYIPTYTYIHKYLVSMYILISFAFISQIITKDQKFLITADRDEKIRISHFPNAYNIETFCLGHKESVH